MKNKNSFFYQSLTYGLFIGIAMSIYSLLLYIAGVDTFNPKGSGRFIAMLGNILLIVGIIYSTKNYRDKVLNGVITYGKALGFGTLLGVTSGFITIFYALIFMYVIEPNTMQYILDISRQAMEERGGLSESQIDKAIEISKAFILPSIIIGGIIGQTIWAFIISLITSIFLKKEGDPFQTAMKDVPNQ